MIPAMLAAYIVLGIVVIGISYSAHSFVKSYAPGGKRHSGIDYQAKWDSISKAKDSIAREKESLNIARALAMLEGATKLDSLETWNEESNITKSEMNELSEPDKARQSISILADAEAQNPCTCV